MFCYVHQCSDFLNDESGNDGSDSRSAGTCAFPFRFEESVGCVDDSVSHFCGVRSGVSVLTLIESIGDVFLLVVLVPIGVEYKGGRLIELFWRPKS